MSIEDIRGLTIYPPWSELVADGLKPIENRGWTPWPSMLGRYLAVHASLRYDVEGADFIDRNPARFGMRRAPRLEDCKHGGIIAVARLVGWVEIGAHGAGQHKVITMLPGHSFVWETDGRWLLGRYGWVLRDAVRFEPVPCRGKQGLWKLDPDVYEKVRRRYDRARLTASA